MKEDAPTSAKHGHQSHVRGMIQEIVLGEVIVK